MPTGSSTRCARGASATTSWSTQASPWRRLRSYSLGDFYRQRVLIPIRDELGRVCGFVGRNLADARWPKYKNPPTTHAYDKSVNLYQPLPAPTDPDGQVVVVEGTLDVLAIATAALRAGKAGLFCPLTQSGRELFDHQVRRIIGLHRAPPVLGFDSDSAGSDSAFRYALSFAPYGSAVTVTILDPGHDPASWLAEKGSRALSTWSRNNHTSWDGRAPIPAATFAARHIFAQDRPPAERMEALVEVAGLATRLPGRSARLWAERVAAVAGPASIAEARGHLLATVGQGAASSRHALEDLHLEPATQARRCYGPAASEALSEGVARWGRRLPRLGDTVFISSASLALEAAALVAPGSARARLCEALGSIERSLDPRQERTPELGREAIRP